MRTFSRSAVLVLACCRLLAVQPVLADDATDPAAPEQISVPDSGATSVEPAGAGKLELSIEEATEMGMRNNLLVEVRRYEAPIGWEEFQAAWGAYDPELFGDYGYQSTQTPTASALQNGGAVKTYGMDGEGGLRGKIPWLNATYGFSYIGQERNTNLSISSLSPEYTSSVIASVRLPLLRNLIWDQDWTRVKQTQIGYQARTEDFRREVMDVVRNIEQAYWGLVAADEQRNVARKSLETADALLRQTETQYEVGVVSKVEVTEADAGVASRQVNLIVATNAYRTAQDRLMHEVLGRGLTAGSELEILPTDRPEDYLIYAIDVEEAARKAFENRPELEILRKDIEARTVELKFRKNQRLPGLDLEGNFGYNGLAGRTNAAPLPPGFPPRDPVTGIGPHFGDSNDDFFSGDGAEQWGIRGILSFPIGNQSARHLADRAELELRRAESELVRLEQNIIVEVRLAARDLHSAQEGISAAERRRIASAEQLRAERIRLEQGESTPFDVLLREEDLAEAESQKISAIQVYRDSVVALDRQQGTILKSRNIVIDDISGLR